MMKDRHIVCADMTVFHKDPYPLYSALRTGRASRLAATIFTASPARNGITHMLIEAARVFFV